MLGFNSLLEMLDLELHIAEQYKYAGFNSLLEMPRVAAAVIAVVKSKFQFSIGDAQGWTPKRVATSAVMSFQFSIGDAYSICLSRILRQWRCFNSLLEMHRVRGVYTARRLQLQFQFSIGDAWWYGRGLPPRRLGVGFNSLLEMPSSAKRPYGAETA